jgi:riboflavin biosynthesis pyrimidine reductase
MNPAQQAERAGIDLSLVDESLRLTPEQRLLQHQSALALVVAAEQAGRELRERQQRPVAAS